MRVIRCNRYFCFFLIVAVLMVGICADIAGTESCFLSVKSISQMHPATIIRNRLARQDALIEENAGSGQQNGSAAKETSAGWEENGEEGGCDSYHSIFVEARLSLKQMVQRVRCYDFGNAVIISYVHSQDGAKSVFF